MSIFATFERLRAAHCAWPAWASIHLLDVRQSPGCLVEERFIWPVEPEQHLELAAGAGRYPVRLGIARRAGCLGPKVHGNGTISALLQAGCLRRAARPRLIADQRMRRAIIGRRRPVLPDGRVHRNRAPIASAAIEIVSGLV